GMHTGGRRALNKAMNRTAAAALEEADVAVLVLEAPLWTPEDELALARIARAHRPAIAAVNKIDRVRPRTRLLPYLAELAGRHEFLAVVPLSALRADNVAQLARTIAAHLPVSAARFAQGEVTDRGTEFAVAELIREKLTLELNQEVPYGIAVEVERLAEEEG